MKVKQESFLKFVVACLRTDNKELTEKLIKQNKKNKVMTQYIDKNILAAEIESYISNYKDILARIDRNDTVWVDFVSNVEAKIDVLQHLLTFIDTIEVKEINE